MGLLSHLHLKITLSVIKDLPERQIAEAFNAYAKKKYGDESKEFLDSIRRKLASVVFEIGRIM